MTATFTYPAMLELQQKKCVIIGGGKVAMRKALALLEAKAAITIIAITADIQIQALAATGKVLLHERPYTDADLREAFIVVAATDDFAINRRIAAAAPCLCNVITEPALGNFIVPAQVSCGDITFAIATQGLPALARLLKQDLKAFYGKDFAALADFLKICRADLKQIPSTPVERTEFWRQNLTQPILDLLRAGQLNRAKEIITDAINRFRLESQNRSR